MSETQPLSSRYRLLKSFELLQPILYLKESRIGMVGALIVLFWVCCAFLAPILPLLEPNAFIAPFQKPGAIHQDGTVFWLGTDHKGRDILSRIIWGAQRILFWSTTATAVAYVIGMLMGVMAVYLGKWVDEVISFVSNLILAFPIIILYRYYQLFGGVRNQYHPRRYLCLRPRYHADCQGVGT